MFTSLHRGFIHLYLSKDLANVELDFFFFESAEKILELFLAYSDRKSANENIVKCGFSTDITVNRAKKSNTILNVNEIRRDIDVTFYMLACATICSHNTINKLENHYTILVYNN